MKTKENQIHAGGVRRASGLEEARTVTAVRNIRRRLLGTSGFPYFTFELQNKLTTVRSPWNGHRDPVMWPEKMGQQLRHPTQSVAGWMATKFFKVCNSFLEKNAVQLCAIQPDDTVLEVGHGPGVGLEAAAKLLTEPTGHLIGVDYSKYMHKMASERVRDLVASGKVTLHHCNVEAMPLADSTVDKVYHCNCYYFWPDHRKGATEIHRVMKAGGLMVTTLRLSAVKLVAGMDILGNNWHPETYMAALRDSGFTDVRMEEKQYKHITFQAIFATALK